MNQISKSILSNAEYLLTGCFFGALQLRLANTFCVYKAWKNPDLPGKDFALMSAHTSKISTYQSASVVPYQNPHDKDVDGPLYPHRIRTTQLDVQTTAVIQENLVAKSLLILELFKRCLWFIFSQGLN